ncbi:MAG: nucleotide exchange factor GrpE [Nitrospirae bacterium]|nr:nucleotide exchange factor GrpE [Nitrospirota bacterium]
MTEEENDDIIYDIGKEEPYSEEPIEETAEESANIEALKESLLEMNDKYLRLYAEFENYKRFAARQKEDQLKYANESLLKDLLTVIDHLELALQHSSDDKASDPLAKGVEMTLKELKTLMERHGLVSIDAIGKPFDPNIHHAMSQIEDDGVDENTVIEEFRKGYMLKERLLRATLVGVSKKIPKEPNKSKIEEEE